MTIAVAASLALVITVASTNSVVSAARSITRDSSSLSETDAAIRSATVARTLTVLSAVAVQEGSTPPSLDEIRVAVDDLAARSAASGPAAAFVEAEVAILGALGRGVAVTPQQVALVENTFQTLLDTQLSRRDDLAAALADSQDRLDQMSLLAGVALLFIVPAVAISVYRGLTKPDLAQAGLLHQADIDQRLSRNRSTLVSREIKRIRREVDRASWSELSRQLDELSVLAGVGLDGAAHDRVPVDLRGAIAKAIARTDLTMTVSGDPVLAIADESDLVTMFSALLSCLDGLDDPVALVRENDGNAEVSLSGVGSIDVSEVLDGPRLWDHEPAGRVDTHLAAARSLADAGGVRIRQVSKGERSGFKIVMPATVPETSGAQQRIPTSATAA